MVGEVTLQKVRLELNFSSSSSVNFILPGTVSTDPRKQKRTLEVLTEKINFVPALLAIWKVF